MTSLKLAFIRLKARPVLSILLLIGLATAITLPMAIPIYSDAATARVLSQQDFQDIGYRPPFAYLFFYSSELEEPVSWGQVAEVDSYLRNEGLEQLGLPIDYATGFVDTRLFDLRQGTDEIGLGSVSMAALDDFAERANMVSGRLPEVRVDGDPIEIVIGLDLAEETGLEVGDIVQAYDPEAELTDPYQTIPVEVVGLWEPRDPADPQWIISPDQLVNRVFVDRAVITEQLSPIKADLIRTAAWYAVMDGSSLTAGDVVPLINNAETVLAEAAQLLPGISRVIDPIDGLHEFQSARDALARRLAAYALPTFGLVLVFLMLAVSLTTNERRSELAVLRSRGASRAQLVGQVGVESALIAAGAYLLAIPLSLGVASLMGSVDTFLGFGARDPLPVQLTPPALKTGLIVALASLILQVLPVWGAARSTVVTHDEMAMQATRRPWWQRSSLDLIVVVVVVVVGYQLLSNEPELGSSLSDPTIILLPALVTLAVGLILLRLLPPVLEVLARGLRYTPSVTWLVALRRAARSPGSSHVPLLLLVVTIGLAIFTASLAETLDLQLVDEAYHQVGADWSVYEADSAAEPSIRGVPAGPRELASIEDFEAIPGIDRATRVAKFTGRLSTASRPVISVAFYGIDRDSFPEVAFFRSDYANSGTVPDAIAALGSAPEAILVHPSLGLNKGEVVDADISFEGSTLHTRFVVAGTLDQFPTWYPEEDAPLVVGNLDQVFLQTGQPALYRVWMSNDDPPAEEIESDISLIETVSPIPQIQETMTAPARQGVFGLLTIGFIGAVFLSLMGFFFATMFRVRMSAVELGALQALGMPPRRVAGVVVVELGILMSFGLAAGVLTGWQLSRWLIVRLVGDSGLIATPPLLAEIDEAAIWGVIVLLIGLFLVTASALVLVLRRMRVFEALKLGENA
ncbi:MAG TPA: ABC transporter permease [Acidimicrobiia bacterium]